MFAKKKIVNPKWSKGTLPVNPVCPADHQFSTSCCVMAAFSGPSQGLLRTPSASLTVSLPPPISHL